MLPAGGAGSHAASKEYLLLTPKKELPGDPIMTPAVTPEFQRSSGTSGGKPDEALGYASVLS